VKPLVVLVEPMHDANVGSIARAMLNFGFPDLALVKPRCKLGLTSRKWGKHAHHILDNARHCRSLKEATRGCSLVVGTTGVPARYNRFIKTCLTPRELARKLRKNERYALVFGPEDRGLDFKEMEACDVLCTIPVHEGVMNLSHSAAVLLYELYEASRSSSARLHYEPAPRMRVKQAENVFTSITEALPKVRDKKKVSRAFAQILHRARPTLEEVQAMLAALGEAEKLALKSASRSRAGRA